MTRPRKPNSSQSIRVIDRAFDILQCFSLSEIELSLSDIAQRSGLSKSTAFRILQALERHRAIVFNPTVNRYSLGIKLFELGGRVIFTLNFRGVAAPYLERLSHERERTVLTGMIEGDELLYIDKRERKDSAWVYWAIDRRRPPHFGMLGMTLMAYMTEEKVDALLKRYPLAKTASRAVTDPKTFKKDLRKIRERGYCFEENAVVDGMLGMAAPIRNHLGDVVAALGITFPTFIASEGIITETIAELMEATDEISLTLGYTGNREGHH